MRLIRMATLIRTSKSKDRLPWVTTTTILIMEHHRNHHSNLGKGARYRLQVARARQVTQDLLLRLMAMRHQCSTINSSISTLTNMLFKVAARIQAISRSSKSSSLTATVHGLHHHTFR